MGMYILLCVCACVCVCEHARMHARWYACTSAARARGHASGDGARIEVGGGDGERAQELLALQQPHKRARDVDMQLGCVHGERGVTLAHALGRDANQLPRLEEGLEDAKPAVEVVALHRGGRSPVELICTPQLREGGRRRACEAALLQSQLSDQPRAAHLAGEWRAAEARQPVGEDGKAGEGDVHVRTRIHTSACTHACM